MSRKEENTTVTRRRRSRAKGASGKTKKAQKKNEVKQQKAKQQKAVEQEVKQKKAIEKEEAKQQEKETKSTKEHRRYRGYDVQEIAKKHPKKEEGWFWKALFTSLGISVMLLIVGVVAVVFFSKKQTDYISGINEKNTLEALLNDKQNLQITTTYANTLDGSDYTAIRLVRQKDDGSYFSYYKTEGLISDYKEVVSSNEVYRNDGQYTYYYAMVGDDYEKKTQEISDDLFVVYENERITSQTESSDTVTLNTEYEVQAGDKYTQIYGYNAGEKIQREIIMDKESSQVASAKETYNDEIIHTYTVEQNVENKTPNFYGKVKKAKTTRKCAVYFDYEGENEKSYTFDVPEDTYFALFDHEGYTVYMDRTQEKEFTQYEMQMQNLENIITLYMVKNEEK